MSDEIPVAQIAPTVLESAQVQDLAQSLALLQILRWSGCARPVEPMPPLPPLWTPARQPGDVLAARLADTAQAAHSVLSPNSSTRAK